MSAQRRTSPRLYAGAPREMAARSRSAIGRRLCGADDDDDAAAARSPRRCGAAEEEAAARPDPPSAPSSQLPRRELAAALRT